MHGKKKTMSDTRGVECFWSNPKEHPQCPHGPTLLFGKYTNGKLEQFYVCSACRDRKLCKFYLKYGDKLTKQQKAVWDFEIKKYKSHYRHQKLYIRFNELMAESSGKRCYCHDCERLFPISDENKHNSHKITKGLSDYQMNHPTELLRPLDDAQKEAQYFFSKKSTKQIVDMLLSLGAKQVLCVGTPRIHEFILENCEDKVSSLLLDFDGRFHNFFGPLNYCWYNLLNHHFFNNNAAQIFKDFLTQNKGQDTYLVCDPPFGARVEPLSWSLKNISDLHKKWNNTEDEEGNGLKIIFIFPYFMEAIMRQKGNPSNVSGGLKGLQMSDYQVGYDNHPLFVTEREDGKQKSVIRIFTNIPLHLLELPESDGYKYCKRCQKWITKENKHCKKCKACTSKSGIRYRHCDLCEKCVKPKWQHCHVCDRCALKNHQCGRKPKILGKCFKCNEFGHTEKECSSTTTETKKAKKRKLDNSTEDKITKKRKVDETKEPDQTEKSRKNNFRKKKRRPAFEVTSLEDSKLTLKLQRKI